jgi:hypothetical protein
LAGKVWTDLSTIDLPIREKVGAVDTRAERVSRENWEANLGTLVATQAGVAEMVQRVVGRETWLFARDGFLTAMDEAGRWESGCSLPGRVAREVLRKLSVSGTTACFVSPSHASQLVAALGMLQRQQAIVAIVPEVRALRVMLHCHDFSGEISRHRVWFASGENWGRELEEIFRGNAGLPTPQQFIRTPLVREEEAAGMMAVAERIFARISQERAGQINQLRDTARDGRLERVCVICPSRFRLWENAGAVLAEAVEAAGEVEVVRVDPDDPCQASGLGLALAVGRSGAVFAANSSRSELPAVIGEGTPIVTWLTMPRIPAAAGAGPMDRLLLSDRRWVKLAEEAGWPGERVGVATWPGRASGEATRGWLAVIADTRDVARPPAEFELSSQQLLWDFIHAELQLDPFLLNENIAAYLASRMKRLEVSERGFDWRLFVDGLIVPAYQQGLVRTLLGAGVAVKLHGAGWEGLAEFSAYAAGQVGSQAEFDSAVSQAAGLVHVWPVVHGHPIDAAGRPVVRRGGHGRDGFILDARGAATGRMKWKASGDAGLSGRIVAEVMRFL